MLLPGVGFDIVPTDCMAAMLKAKMPDAKYLELGFVAGSASGGTLKTAVESLPNGSLIRKNGEMTKTNVFEFKRKVQINQKEHALASIPWGDVYTAYYSTGIENIIVYTNVPSFVANTVGLIRPFFRLFRNRFIMKSTQNLIGRLVDGPNEEARETTKAYIWGEVRNEKGESIQGSLTTVETYKLTRDSAILCLEKVLAGKVKPGFQTPSLAFGKDLVLEIDGSEVLNL